MNFLVILLTKTIIIYMFIDKSSDKVNTQSEYTIKIETNRFFKTKKYEIHDKTYIHSDGSFRIYLFSGSTNIYYQIV